MKVEPKPEPTTSFTSSTMAPAGKILTKDQIDHFLEHGFVRLEACFTPAKASEWTETVWTRLGMDPADKSTWTKERINMPPHKSAHAREFAPKAWSAICELLGGEDRVDGEKWGMWRDTLIVNLGTDEWEGKPYHPSELTEWHVDGDFFMHYLDSPEQALLIIPVFSDIKPTGGGTMICPEAIPIMAKHLHDHPEGVSPYMVPRGQPPPKTTRSFYIDAIKRCTDFREMTGNIGDVILMHPLMVHTASRNTLRIPRIITNPPAALREPFNFDREDASEYSIVELKTLKSLGVDRLKGWKITAEREMLVPERVKRWEKMKEEEERRLKEAQSSNA